MNAQIHVVASSNLLRSLCAQLTGYWADDVWDLNACPALSTQITWGRVLRFRCHVPSINEELKVAFKLKFERKEWTVPGHHAGALSWIIKWLSHLDPQVTSFLDQSLIW